MTTTSGTVASRVDAAQLYERYGDQIYRYCLRRLRNREEAADAAQNTFLRIHVALAKGVVPQYEAAWLYKIAHNACLAWIESSGRRALVETPRSLDSLDEATLTAPTSDREALEELAEALAALPANLRTAILLREWHGLTYAEIAAAMDTTVSAVETLLVRARRRLSRAAAGVLDVLGLRGLLSSGLGKLAAGAALVAVGGSGIGATVALSDRPSAPPARPATAPARPKAAALPQRSTATPPARLPRRRATTARVQTRRAVTPAAPRPVVSTPPPTAPAATTTAPTPAAHAPAPLPAATPATAQAPAPAVAVPSLPHAASVSTPTLPAVLPPAPQVAQTVTGTAPPLPVTTPTLAVPALATP